MSVIPQEPCSGTLSRLRNLYPRSTQNTDAVFSINFPNPGVSCLITLLLNSEKKQSVLMLPITLGQCGDRNDNSTVTVSNHIHGEQ